MPSIFEVGTPWQQAETAFRLMAFHTKYTHAFRHEPDLTLRFAYALIASSRPIPERMRDRVMAWWRDNPKRTAKFRASNNGV